MKRFVICPGEVTSQTDGDRHFIGGGQLIRLYKVNPQECIFDSEKERYGYGHDWSQYIFLMPRYRGDYEEHLQFKLDERGWEL